MSDPRKADSGAGQEPEDVALDSLAKIWPIRDSITSPDEAAMFEAEVRPILTRLVRAGQRRSLVCLAKEIETWADRLHEEMELGQAEGLYEAVRMTHARLALLREE